MAWNYELTLRNFRRRKRREKQFLIHERHGPIINEDKMVLISGKYILSRKYAVYCRTFPHEDLFFVHCLT